MERDFESVLNLALDMQAQGADIEACLQSFPRYADRLRPLLSAAALARGVRVPEPSPEALLSGQQALMAALVDHRANLTGQEQRRGIGRSLIMLGAAAALAAFALIGLALGGPLRDAFDFGTDIAVADGTVTNVAGRSLDIETDDGVLTSVILGEDTVIQLADGTRLDLSALTPGTEIRIRGHQEGEGTIQAQLIEVGGEGQGLDDNSGSGVGADDDSGSGVGADDGSGSGVGADDDSGSGVGADDDSGSDGGED